jgi:hypothetical protein
MRKKHTVMPKLTDNSKVVNCNNIGGSLKKLLFMLKKKSDNSHKLISLLISTYSSKIISWAEG